MKNLKYVSLLLIAFVSILGCSGANGELKTLSESESKVTQQELIDNWSDYDVWLFYATSYIPPQLIAIIFDPNNDDRKILVGSDWRKVKNQEKWTKIVKANTTSDGDFKIRRDYSDGTSTVQEIWGPDNQLYGYAINTARWLVYTRLVEENTLRLEIRLRNYNATSAPP